MFAIIREIHACHSTTYTQNRRQTNDQLTDQSTNRFGLRFGLSESLRRRPTCAVFVMGAWTSSTKTILTRNCFQRIAFNEPLAYLTSNVQNVHLTVRSNGRTSEHILTRESCLLLFVLRVFVHTLRSRLFLLHHVHTKLKDNTF